MKILDSLWGMAFSLWNVNAEMFVNYLDVSKQYYSNTGFCAIPLIKQLQQQDEIFIKKCSLLLDCPVDNISCELLYNNIFQKFYIGVSSSNNVYEMFEVFLEEEEMIFLKKFLSANNLWQININGIENSEVQI